MSEYLPNDISRYCFIDTETLSGADLKASGAYVYSEDPAFRVMIVTYAIGDGPVQVWMQDRGHAGEWLDWNDAPDDLLAHLERVEAGDAWFVAWNAAFDRLALSRGIRGYSGAQPEHFLDAMAQAVRSHLPPDLAGAGAMVGAPIQKRASGRKLIKKFCIEMASPGSDPEAWQEFVAYALDDIPPMRTVWQATLALPLSEWRTYWATEGINDRGISMDVPFAVRASQLADEVYARADAEIHLATSGEVTRVTQSARLLQWALRQAADLPEVAGILTREMEQTGEVDEDDAPVTVATYSMGRAHVEALIAYLERLEVTDGLTDAHAALLRAMEVRLWGASSTPRKFTSALNSNSGGRLRGQFVFNGAPATGRWSSRQVQVQNLSRSTVGDTNAECDAIDLICALGADAYVPLRERFGPVGRTLSRLIRPLFVPPDGRRLATCDWSAIEARVLPWLAGDSVGAGGLLDVFAATDSGVTKHDVYVMTAAGILGIEPGEVSKAQRQSHGKVPVLALGFAGGSGALHAMATAYGAHFTDEEAADIVSGWRKTNAWAVDFWAALWRAVEAAMASPGVAFQAGRVTIAVEAGYMGRTLVIVLPSGRLLLYPKLRYEDIERRDIKTGALETRRGVLTYRRGRGRAVLHKGTVAENVTQATAACLLRAVVPLIEGDPLLDPVMLVHDEVVCEVDEGVADEATTALRAHMLRAPSWAEGLPLNAEAEHAPYYSKTF